MWPFKRRKKSSRKELKQVYYYTNDYITLRVLSKDQKKSMTRMAGDILNVYVGYKYGSLQGQIEVLTLERNAAAVEMRRLRKQLDLYIELFGKLPKSDSKQEKTDQP